MQPMATVTLAACLCLLPWLAPGPNLVDGSSVAGPEERGAQEEDELPRRPDPREQKEELILGAWQLVGGKMEEHALTGGNLAGYLIVMEGYLSLEVHGRFEAESGRPVTFFQTGTMRWKLDAGGNLATSSLIGTSNWTTLTRVAFTEPGGKQTYRLDVSGRQLTLERPGQSRLVFRRLSRLPFPDRRVRRGEEREGR